ncbi:MAG: glutamate--cysteine ligase [Pseudomonadota bacterium]|nr:glutamate--cysteine ligase [Pseudomonadota bacterium]
MHKLAQIRLARLFAADKQLLLDGRLIGLEKETLRVAPQGGLSQKPHPRSLGSALTHPYITTDYSEALMEFITPPFGHSSDALAFLRDAQAYVYGHLDDEQLWATSMPCVVACEEGVPIAWYGSSNAGMMKHVYRRGLGYRYGKVMQVIAGVHFNYSLPENFWRLYQEIEGSSQTLREFIDEQYFALIRNLQRFGWLIPYLFGASPAVCKSFLCGKSTSLSEFDANTYYGPFATSLRMGDIGYQNNKENEIGIKACYRNLEAYIQSLQYAISTPYKGYEEIGVKVNGEYRQLNANILQIENEYYSTVRPKQILEGYEKPTLALKRRGVRYIELRSLDVNAFEPLGINAMQMKFIEALMVYCLLQDSQQICHNEQYEIDQNELDVAHKGRDPQLKLQRDARAVSLRQWALEICDDMQGVCELLDRSHPDKPYMKALAEQREKVTDPQLTPSARMLQTMRENGEGFYRFARRMSQQHFDYFRQVEITAEQRRFFDDLAVSSLQKQAQLEADNSLSFDEFLQNYFSQC